jgi:hypothetical protein
VKVNYKSVNPTYTITAPYGSEGRGGCIVTEWCDKYAGYINWTTNFIVAGSNTNVTLQQAAEIGVMAAGSSAATSEESDGADWRRTGWVIFLFILLAVLGTIFLLAMIRLCYKRITNKSYATVESSSVASSQARRGSDPHTTDFTTVGGDSPVRNANRAIIHDNRSRPIEP